eukprot:2237404-Pyramimonas_sp.AAC.1
MILQRSHTVASTQTGIRCVWYSWEAALEKPWAGLYLRQDTFFASIPDEDMVAPPWSAASVAWGFGLGYDNKYLK